ncbi:hypothetical protein D0863_04130 [Hortaea werneckii]|uniref:F-box domain-containing protein n=1 Tax=Hortaea werneckii TaxID=91943 RepID=A0A3M7EAF5_HORWE|nr:hypothetical protein D0863_04130 [Hortaea werneckii]
MAYLGQRRFRHMLLADTHMASDTDAPKMTSQATRRALGIPELLEAILYHLPFQNLLRAQSVCKQWQTVIDHSKKLQRALYFEPVFWDHVALCEGRARCTLYAVDTNTAMQSLKGPPFQGAVHIYRHGSPGVSNRVLYGQVPVNNIAQCTLGHIADGLEQQLQAFGGRYLLSCEVPGWVDWQIEEVNEQLNMP